ncbi:hypothetical protein [Streptomyces sp. N35]|uniref:hypothetical protein n=1 Tax=Streptomyces sp. N35 TaxID=2795730 RepID=UPI0018F7281A|nr:hypothetical protein [Streptomyces sp. N35]
MKVLIAVAALAALIALALAGGTGGTEDENSAEPETTGKPRPFTIAVVTAHASRDRAAAARVALDELRALLRDNKSPGRLPLEFVAVRPRDGLTAGALRRTHPRLVAVVADEPLEDMAGSPVPVVGTCRPDEPPGPGEGFTATVAPEVAEVGWQLRTYLAKKQRTQRLLVFGAWGTDAEIAEQLGERGADPAWGGPKPAAVTVEIQRPAHMTAGELRAALSRDKGRTAVHLSGTRSTLAADLRALGRAGYRGTVLHSPGIQSPCYETDHGTPGPVPAGITVHRVDTVAPGAVREKDCQRGNTERCPWLVRLPDRPGALEEYEAAQVLVRMYRTVWYEGRGRVPDDPDAMAGGLREGVGEQIGRSLGGWFDPSGQDQGHTFGFGHDIWLHRWTARDGGRWERLGPVSALYW